jgi:hypothetical protein
VNLSRGDQLLDVIIYVEKWSENCTKFDWDVQYSRIYDLGTSPRNEREGECVLISFSLFGSF